MTSQRQEFFDAKKDKMEYLKTHDSLTGMFNLAGLRKHTSRLDLGDYELLLVDINDFKRINDYFGYDEGSQVLINFSNFLLKTIGSKGIVSRAGSDEFILFMKRNINGESGFSNQLFQRMEAYFEETLILPVSLACGVAAGSNEYTIDDIYSMAETALYNQKKSGESGLMYYNDALREQDMTEHSLSLDLHHAFDKKEFILYFQPQVNSAGEVHGYEALVRWAHPTRGIINPGGFLHLIQKENLIKELDRYILERAFERLEKWKHEGLNAKLSINLTTPTLLDKEIIFYARSLINKYDVRASQLCIEITEDYDIFKQEIFSNILGLMRREGIQIAIDDFGTGYASLNKIIKYDIDIIKIDKTMVDDIVSSSKDLTVLKGIIGIFMGIGFDLVIEGIETEDQLACIEEIEGLVYQGYYFGKPSPNLVDA